MTKSKSKIPHGFHCYDSKGVCPYWSIDRSHLYQENGYCEFLERGDWMEGWSSLLWDQCKECGINEYTEEEIKEAIDKGGDIG
jgi:hypothetical protein